MDSGLASYPMPPGVHAIPANLLDLRSDAEIDYDLLHPSPVISEKNIWFFWHSGYASMQPYTQRNVRAWHRRFAKHGWAVRVMDRALSSVGNVANFLDTADPSLFPRAFTEDAVTGPYAMQHTSDLVRWPLLLAYGGVYADVGLMQIGDLDRLWRETVAAEGPTSRFEVASYNCGGPDDCVLANYFLMARPGNQLFARCHRLFLALWASDGGRTDTEGMHSSPLVRRMPLMGKDGGFTFEENGRTVGPEESSRLLTDYIIQGQVMSLVMGLIDEEDGWHGPKYVAKHVYGIDYMVGSQLINQMTVWDGEMAFRLMSLHLPKGGEVETEEQKQAREIVEACLLRSFGFKLAHGIILKMIGPTLGSLWRENDGSDNVPGTYAHWLRHSMTYWNQDGLPPTQEYKEIEPFKKGPLLREL